MTEKNKKDWQEYKDWCDKYHIKYHYGSNLSYYVRVIKGVQK
jgi:hypothetical protein